MKQEHQVRSLNNCISELQQQASAQRLELQDAQHGFVESRREQVRLQEELSMKDKVLRNTHIRNMHGMGEMKRAQELRVDEVSVQNWEKITRQYRSSVLSCRKCKTRWILWMILEIFKKWIQITAGDCLTFPVDLQCFQVLVPCWAALNACLSAHGLHMDFRKTFLVIDFLRLIHPETILKEFSRAHPKVNEDQFHKPQGRRLFSQEMTNKIEA